MKAFTVTDIANETGRSKRAVQHAARDAVTRGVLDSRKTRDWLFDDREKRLIVSMLVGRGKRREDVDTFKSMF